MNFAVCTIASKLGADNSSAEASRRKKPRKGGLRSWSAYGEEDLPVRPSKFTEEQIAQALQRVDAGTPAVQVCRELGITETTFYRWRKQYDRSGVSPSGEMRQLRDENQKLKQIVANLLLDNARAGSRGQK